MDKSDKKTLDISGLSDRDEEVLGRLFTAAFLPDPKKGFVDDVMSIVLESRPIEQSWSYLQWLLPTMQLAFSVFVFANFEWGALLSSQQNALTNVQDDFVDTDTILLSGLSNIENTEPLPFDFSTALGVSMEDVL